jgi:hypothetical protein
MPREPPMTNAALPASTPIRAADVSPVAVATEDVHRAALGGYKPARLVLRAK